MIIAILLFGILIIIHELGHYLAARWAGITVLEFAIGMGPTVWSKTKHGTRYALRLLPFGGFVRMAGEDGAEDPEPQRDTVPLQEAPIFKRAVVMSAGAFMNLACALLVMIGLAAFDDVIVTTTINKFSQDSISQRSGLAAGDRLIRIGDRNIHISTDILYALAASSGPQDVVVERDGHRLQLRNVSFPMQQGSNVNDFTCTRAPMTPLGALREGYFRCVSMMREVYGALLGMLTGRVPLSDLSGFVGTTQAISQVAKFGLVPLVTFGVFISINLGIFNLLPFPALDGGRLLFLLIEKLRGKAIRPEVEGMFNLAGFALLMLLVLLVTFRDVSRLFAK